MKADWQVEQIIQKLYKPLILLTNHLAPPSMLVDSDYVNKREKSEIQNDEKKKYNQKGKRFCTLT